MIYLYYGDDDFRRQNAIDALSNELVDPSWRSVNLIELNNPNPGDFADHISNIPFGMGQRLVIVKDAKFLEKKSDDETVSIILEALNSLSEGVSILFNSKKITGTIKLVKQLKKNAYIEEFAVFAPWDIKKATSWLRSEIRKKNQKLSEASEAEGQSSFETKVDDRALEFLVDYIGTDSAVLINELEKLSLMAKGSPIDQALITKELKPRHDIFAFAKEISRANQAQASKELQRIIMNDEIHLGFLSALQTSVQRYLKAKLLASSPGSDAEKAKALSISPGRFYYLRQEIGPMKLPYLELLNEKLYSMEKKLKRGETSLEQELRVLVAS